MPLQDIGDRFTGAENVPHRIYFANYLVHEGH